MIHFLLFLVCILSVEIFIKSNFLSYLYSMLKVMKKAAFMISQNNISDHWKEKAIPAYALRIMKHSLQILLILLIIMSLFFIADIFFNDFLALTLSLLGIIESIIFVFGYVYLRKMFIK